MKTVGICLLFVMTLAKPIDAIHGGDPVGIRSAPFVALYRPIGRAHWCGAVILTDQYLASAASCYQDDRMYQVTVGSDSVTGGSTHRILEHIVHPNFNTSNHDNDIVLIKLASRLIFNNDIRNIERVGSLSEIHLPTEAFGFGKTESGQESSVLLKVFLPYIKQRECQKLYKDFQLTASMLCAGGVIGRDTCDHDQGGPLTWNGTLAGLTSWGLKECGSTTPRVYTNVVYLRDWINGVIY